MAFLFTTSADPEHRWMFTNRFIYWLGERFVERYQSDVDLVDLWRSSEAVHGIDFRDAWQDNPDLAVRLAKGISDLAVGLITLPPLVLNCPPPGGVARLAEYLTPLVEGLNEFVATRSSQVSSLSS